MMFWAAIGSVAAVLGVVPVYVKALGHWVVLFPQRRAARLVGREIMKAIRAAMRGRSSPSLLDAESGYKA